MIDLYIRSGEPLRPLRQKKGLLHHRKDRRLLQTQHRSRCPCCQHKGRQYHVERIAISGGRQELPLFRKDQHHHDPQPERRHRNKEECHELKSDLCRMTFPARRPYARRDAEQDHPSHRPESQVEGDRKSSHELGQHRSMCQIRYTQISHCRMCEPAPILHPKRLIQPHALPHRKKLRLRRFCRTIHDQYRQRRISGRKHAQKER